MNVFAASENQLALVKKACEEFRSHWISFKNMPFVCHFSGTMEDVDALDFLDYEGLGYPASQLEGVALVWGNVLATQLGMKWVTTQGGEILLTHDEPGRRVTLWPFARVLEVRERSLPQFGRYAWLLNVAVRDLLNFSDLSEDSAAWARNVIGAWDKSGNPWA